MGPSSLERKTSLREKTFFLFDEGPMLETLDYTIRIGSIPTFLYFDLYFYSAYAAHYVYFHFNLSTVCPALELTNYLAKPREQTERERTKGLLFVSKSRVQILCIAKKKYIAMALVKF